jgi:hypothetical protein
MKGKTPPKKLLGKIIWNPRPVFDYNTVQVLQTRAGAGRYPGIDEPKSFRLFLGHQNNHARRGRLGLIGLRLESYYTWGFLDAPAYTLSIFWIQGAV